MNYKSIDYLQYSLQMSQDDFISYYDMIKPIANYRVGYRLPDGTRVYFGNALSNKALYVLDGTTLHNMEVNGVLNLDYLEAIMSRGAKVSRIDLQVTQFVDSDLITPDDYLEFFKQGLIASSHVKYGVKYYASVGENYEDNIETLYIGDKSKRGKRGIVRAYDKGVELDLGKYLISRLEVEDKRDNAMTSVKRLLKGASIGSVIKTRFDVKHDRWSSLIDSESIDTSRGQAIEDTSESDEMERRWNWLINTVAKSLGQAIAHDDIESGYSNNKLEFEAKMTQAYEQYMIENS